MEITLVIVDDNKYIAEGLQKIVESYPSVFQHEEVVYKVIEVFKGNAAFSNAREYITAHQGEIDILLIDYHLGRGLGTDLFNLVKKEHKIYRILHSETDDSLDEAQEGRGKIYDHFCKTKQPEKIFDSLEKYERNILALKLYGNPVFRDKSFVSRAKIDKTFGIPAFGGIKLFDILYAQSIGNDQVTIHYLNLATPKVDSLTRTTERLPYFINSPFPFKYINTQIVINLLWVAKINASENKIRFITLDNMVYEISYVPSPSTFNNEIKPLISDIDNNIPSFLRD